jgi:RND superfamily putative drug exporter
VTLVFQDGIGASLLGVAGPLDGIFPAIPVLVFCVVFGLSMDYRGCSSSRVCEARSGRPLAERDAIASGLCTLDDCHERGGDHARGVRRVLCSGSFC